MISSRLLGEEVRGVCELFKQAAKLHILPYLNRATQSEKFIERDLSEVVTEADIASSVFLLDRLRVRYPGSYSEEHLYDDRWDHELLWQIDPLDGTSEFCAGLKEFFAVQGALLERRGGEYVPVAGIIHLPGPDLSLFSVHDTLIAQYGEAEITLCPPVAEPKLKCFVRKVDGMPWEGGDNYYERLAAELGKQVVRHETGGAGAAFAELLQGKIDIVVMNVDYTKEWDTAMAQPMLSVLGGWICDLEGNNLSYNNRATVFHPKGFIASITVPKDVALKHVNESLLVRKRSRRE